MEFLIVAAAPAFSRGSLQNWSFCIMGVSSRLERFGLTTFVSGAQSLTTLIDLKFELVMPYGELRADSGKPSVRCHLGVSNILPS